MHPTVVTRLTIKNINSDIRVIAQVSKRENITHLKRTKNLIKNGF